MTENGKTREIGGNWIYHQAFSALVVAYLASRGFGTALKAVLLAWFFPVLDGAAEATSAPPAGVTAAWAALFLAAVFFWLRPVAKFLSPGGAALRETALRRVNGVYAFIAKLVVLTYAASVAFQFVRLHEAPAPIGLVRALAEVLLPKALSAYYLFYFAFVYLEPLLLSKVAAALCDEESIFRRKPGVFLSVRAKLMLMVANLVVIPMSLMCLTLLLERLIAPRNATHLEILFYSLVYAAGCVEVVHRSISGPLTELVGKMGRLAKGDFDVKTPVLSGDEIGTLTAHFNEMLDGLAERERLRDTFGRYVSVEVAKQLLDSGKISLGGESIEATVLFSDIRDFTPMSERLPPHELVAFLNRYFSHITEPIMAHHGMVNKFIGDAVMAVFAPQFGSKGHVDDAVRAVLGMRASLDAFNAERPGLPPVRFGIGLHTGVLIAGNIGTERRMEYTVIGDTVNIASRIESQNKPLSSTVLMSEDVYRGLSPSLRDELTVERCEDIRVKGKVNPLVLYKLL